MILELETRVLFLPTDSKARNQTPFKENMCKFPNLEDRW